MSTRCLIWAILTGEGGFHAGEISVEDIGSTQVVALHPSKRSAVLGLRRLNLMMNLGHLPLAKENRDVIGTGIIGLMRELAQPVLNHPY